ncbi:MAG: C25 family cysteine peptidase [Candidatus Eisenbacteria bacterium]
MAVIILLACAVSGAAREWVAIDTESGAPEAAARVVQSGPSGIAFEIEVPGFYVETTSDLGDVVLRIPGAQAINAPGLPDLPAMTYFVAIPNRGGVELEMHSVGEKVLPGYSVAPSAEPVLDGEAARPTERDLSVYAADALFPPDAVTVGEPIVMRDVRVVPVTVYPLRWSPSTGELVATGRMTVRLNYTSHGENEKTVERAFRSEAFEPLYENFLLNYDELPRAEVRRGSYLVITQDAYELQMADFVEWKTKRGVETVLVTLSDIGASPTNQDIKDYIQTAYTTWENPPDYVLLVGDTWTGGPAFPCWYISAGGPQDVTDHPYALLDGSDYFPEVIVGRMSIDTTAEATVAGLKAISYERGDALTDAWYEKALVCAGNYGGAHVTSPRQTSLRVGEMLTRCGYAQVDTVFYKPVTSPVPISNSINAGVSFVNYRGWGNADGWEYPHFIVSDIYALTNGEMLAPMTSIVCGTGNFDSWPSDPCFAEAWIRAGTPGALRGGPAIIAPSHANTHTKENNYICVGFYEGALFEDLRHFGQAVLRGKMELYRHFPFDLGAGGMVEFHFHIYNIVGDPELYLRTGIPGSFSVSHDATVSLGDNALAVHVTDSSGDAVPGAEIVVWKDGESFEVRELEGGVNASMPLNAQTAGAAYVTVVGKNMRPYTGAVTVAQDAQYVGWYSHTIDDDGSGASSGNGDGVVNPGETIEVAGTFKNYGTAPVGPSSFVLTIEDDDTDGCVVTQGGAGATGFAAGGTAVLTPSWVLDVQNGENGDKIRCRATGTDGGRGTWTSEFTLVVGAPVLAYDSVVVNDGGDGVLDPGETATLTVTLANTSYLDATTVAGTLRAPTSGLTAGDDAGSWGTIAGNGTGSNAGNTFTVTAAANVAIGHEFTLAIDLTGDDGLSQFVLFPLVVGTPSTSDPQGPDEYGYYCYDDTDTAYSEAPTYSWVEIDPTYGGSGTDVGLGYEEVTDVALPFTFRYYGEDFDTMAVCGNGDVGLGGAPYWEHQPRNAKIPCPLGPDAMIAPFWDNLFPSDPDTTGGAGKVLTRDMGDGRYVVEWSRVGTGYENGGATQTFELVLYDQDVYATGTGDGEILFQYHTIANSDTHNYATVGIENPTQSGGLECTYFGIYAPEAAPLANGRAIKFTTDPPDAYPSTGVEDGAVAVGVLLHGNRPNPFNPSTVVSFTMPSTGHAELAVYDVAGRKVATLFEGEAEAGDHRAAWNGRSDSGVPVATGVYFARLSAMGEERSSKMVLLK